jgi:hypothetical protein
MIAAKLAKLKDGHRPSSNDEGAKREDAALMLSVSTASLDRAKYVLEHGSEAVKQAVIKDDAECLAMFREAMKEQGNNQYTSNPNNVKDAQVIAGNSKAYTCERLKKQTAGLVDMRHG